VPDVLVKLIDFSAEAALLAGGHSIWPSQQ
jgi:hypothetical protein